MTRTSRRWIVIARNQKTCVICGNKFYSPPSSKTVTCSKECRSERAAKASRDNKGKRFWSKEKIDARRKDPKVLGKLAIFQPLATTKALENPLNQRGPQNREAKIWTIYPPDSDEAVVVTNLKHWARENYELFEPGSDDIDATAERICSGFHAIAQTLKGNRGGSGKQRGTTTYKGWSMRTLPEVPKKRPTSR